MQSNPLTIFQAHRKQISVLSVRPLRLLSWVAPGGLYKHAAIIGSVQYADRFVPRRSIAEYVAVRRSWRNRTISISGRSLVVVAK